MGQFEKATCPWGYAVATVVVTGGMNPNLSAGAHEAS